MTTIPTDDTKSPADKDRAMSEYHGHNTLIDGSTVPLVEDEAKALWQAVEKAKADRAVALPTAVDALRAHNQALERLRELGWWPGGGLRVRRGDECAVAQFGSTGMWRGHVDAEGKYVHFGDSMAQPRDTLLKPLSDLTDEERRHMADCDAREAEAFAAEIKRFGAWSEQS